MATKMEPITLMGYRCKRCDHRWVPRNQGETPRVCPRCKSAYWNVERKRPKVATTE